MKWFGFIWFLACVQHGCIAHNVYVLIWGSTQTETGAGHSSIAFEDTTGFHYYSHYPSSDGGVKGDVLQSIDEVLLKDSIEGLQDESPQLVLEFDVSEKEYKKMKKQAKRKSKRTWTLLGLNCADFIKSVFKKSNYDLGLAFLISTPYELVSDLRDHNVKAFRHGKVKTVKGFIHPYLKKQPRAVPYTVKKFFTGKK